MAPHALVVVNAEVGTECTHDPRSPSDHDPRFGAKVGDNQNGADMAGAGLVGGGKGLLPDRSKFVFTIDFSDHLYTGKYVDGRLLRNWRS